MNHQCFTWEDRIIATAKHVLKVGLKLSNDLSTRNEILVASEAVGRNHNKQKGNTEKCQKHHFLFHKWTKRDLYRSTTDPIGKDKRKAITLACTASGKGGYKQVQGYKNTKDDEIKDLKAQIAAVIQTGKEDTEPTA